MRPLFFLDTDALTKRRHGLVSTATRLTAAMIGAMIVMRPSIAAPQSATPTTPSPTPPAASQNPSPMVEQTRIHERLAPKPLGGVTCSFVGPAGKPVEILVPDQARTRDVIDLVVHFHGSAWLPEQAVAGLDNHPIAAVVNLGTGSGTYDRGFADPAVFDSLLAAVTREVSTVTGKPARVGSVTLVGFSAGHGAVRAILREPRHFAKVDAVLLLDGMHTSYIPDGTVIALGGTLDTTNLVAFAKFAQAAIRGEKRFLITHSEIFPGTFASTTETADWLLRTLNLRRTPVLRWGPRGMQQLSEVRAGRFEVMGFAGSSAPDHIDQLHAMPELLSRLFERSVSAKPGHHYNEEAVAGGMLATGGDPVNSRLNDWPPHREIAITFDDLPGVAMLRSQRCNAKAFAKVNRKLLRTIASHRIPAFGLVVEGNICQGQRRALPDLLGMWLNAGLDLGNHSFSHFDLNTTPLATYQADVVRGETVTRKLLQQRGKALRYFRHPFLHAGKDLATKRAFEKFLTERGYRIAPVTIDNQEWVFAEVYAVAKERKDKATADRVAAAYIDYMESVFDFFEKRSVEVVGHEIKQVLLLHVNPLNADYLEELVRMMKKRGYSFISLDQALQDPAYRLPDNYAGPIGLSWIHRWGLTKGMALKNEPPEPEFIATLFRDYRN